MVRFSKFMIPSLYLPDAMFEVMIQKQTLALNKYGKFELK